MISGRRLVVSAGGGRLETWGRGRGWGRELAAHWSSTPLPFLSPLPLYPSPIPPRAHDTLTYFSNLGLWLWWFPNLSFSCVRGRKVPFQVANRKNRWWPLLSHPSLQAFTPCCSGKRVRNLSPAHSSQPICRHSTPQLLTPQRRIFSLINTC